MNNALLIPGTPAPWFKCRTDASSEFSFDIAAGRYIVLYFFGSAADAASSALISAITAERQRFNGHDACFFGISTNPDDEQQGRLADQLPGIRYLRDFDKSVTRAYGALSADDSFQPVIYVIDPMLRVLSVIRCADTPENSAASLSRILASLPALGPAYRAPAQAPVLVVPRVFEPDLCQALMDYYDAHGGKDSGFMRDINGRTSLVIDHRHKRRRDCSIEDKVLQNACVARIRDRLAPEIHKAYQFLATRIERQIVACYDAAEEGHFRPHRDNTTRGTAHRRFAVSLFLNSGDYDGGHLRFPEYGRGLYAAPRGGAVVFSCSLLHEATPVTRGRRYMYLPFLYDETGRQVREANFQYLGVPENKADADSSGVPAQKQEETQQE